MSLKQHIQSVICDREPFIQSLENIIIDCKVWFQQEGAKAHTSEVVTLFNLLQLSSGVRKEEGLGV